MLIRPHRTFAVLRIALALRKCSVAIRLRRKFRARSGYADVCESKDELGQSVTTFTSLARKLGQRHSRWHTKNLAPAVITYVVMRMPRGSGDVSKGRRRLDCDPESSRAIPRVYPRVLNGFARGPFRDREGVELARRFPQRRIAESAALLLERRQYFGVSAAGAAVRRRRIFGLSSASSLDGSISIDADFVPSTHELRGGIASAATVAIRARWLWPQSA